MCRLELGREKNSHHLAPFDIHKIILLINKFYPSNAQKKEKFLFDDKSASHLAKTRIIASWWHDKQYYCKIWEKLTGSSIHSFLFFTSDDCEPFFFQLKCEFQVKTCHFVERKNDHKWSRYYLKICMIAINFKKKSLIVIMRACDHMVLRA